jgi:hypothetical protein
VKNIPEPIKTPRRIFVGGLVEGINYPKGKKTPVVDLEGCNEIIIVSSTYFLKNKAMLEAWASGK